MIGYTKINLKEMSEMIEPEKLQKIISDFSCPYNKDVEYFFMKRLSSFPVRVWLLPFWFLHLTRESRYLLDIFR